MTPTDRADSLVDDRSEEGFVFPDYGGRCFAGVPGTCYDVLGADVGPTLPSDVVGSLTGGAAVNRVVAVVVDGFGWDQLRRERGRRESLDRLLDAGRLEPLTSTFPSETAAAMTTFDTASYPCEHGVLGWYQYVESLDEVVLPLPFTDAAGTPLSEVAPEFGRDDLFRADAADERATPGVSKTTVRPADIGGDREYETLDGFGRSLSAAVDASDSRSFVFAYVPHVDAAAHRVGTRHGEYHDAVCAVFDAVAGALDGASGDGDTLFLVTADHGHVDTDPATNVDLRDDRFDPLWETFERRGDGRPVPPTGSPRQLHLRVRDGARDEARAAVDRHLDALVFDREEAVERELWGPGAYDEEFRSRLGDLLVVPRERGVWYGDDELAYAGMHGGMTRAEMLVPVLGVRA